MIGKFLLKDLIDGTELEKRYGRKEVRERLNCSSGKCVCKDCTECDHLLIKQVDIEAKKVRFYV